MEIRLETRGKERLWGGGGTTERFKSDLKVRTMGDGSSQQYGRNGKRVSQKRKGRHRSEGKGIFEAALQVRLHMSDFVGSMLLCRKDWKKLGVKEIF